jgi:hypothetical protein
MVDLCGSSATRVQYISHINIMFPAAVVRCILLYCSLYRCRGTFTVLYARHIPLLYCGALLLGSTGVGQGAWLYAGYALSNVIGASFLWYSSNDTYIYDIVQHSIFNYVCPL